MRKSMTTDKDFTDTDLTTWKNSETGEDMYSIHTDAANLILDELDWQKAGLSQTASGYGRKLTSAYKISFNGKLYRLYTICFSNAGSTYFTAKGKQIFVS